MTVPRSSLFMSSLINSWKYRSLRSSPNISNNANLPHLYFWFERQALIYISLKCNPLQILGTFAKTESNCKLSPSSTTILHGTNTSLSPNPSHVRIKTVKLHPFSFQHYIIDLLLQLSSHMSFVFLLQQVLPSNTFLEIRLFPLSTTGPKNIRIPFIN